MAHWKMQKAWPLGLLGFVGFWKLPEVLAFFSSIEASWWDFSNLLWFLWFLYFLPDDVEADAPKQTPTDPWGGAWDHEEDR